ncbi:hypothetical protein H7J77_09255 [Mycolicibacillus parakoreensis]|uniref:PE-PGRS family protein n=1 Tax=Mycolicibacillus parakoreensis TaxID=1069221 RepID=A0ABY3TYY5_9MYCO|nr:hypothetical protein [Mycolicibacillus parakoreensis]MCV7315728.1 hypothetical protein [Mycolicibacillus parakoreensis]ULN51838.1 hypothetical protein MIU77_13235 [Mycolicibacillus parakoreensis]
MNTAPHPTMRPALRPYATAGVALAGAGLIAAAPVLTPLPETHVPQIQLTAGIGDGLVDVFSGFDPTFGWLDVLGNSATNVASIAEGVLDNGTPALSQFLSNQLGYGTTLLGGLQGAVTGTLAWFFDDQPGNNIGFFVDGMMDLIKAGDFIGAGGIFNSGITSLLFSAALPILPAAQIPGEIVQHLANVVGDVGNGLTGSLLAGVINALSPVFATGQAIFASLQAISDAAGPLEGLAALINTPANLTDAFLNGFEKVVDGVPPALTPGFLTPLLPDGAGIGPLAFLTVGIPQIIAEALGGDATGGLTGVLAEFADTAMALPEQLVNSITDTVGDIFDVGSLTDGLADLLTIGDLAGLGDVFTMLDPTMFIEPLLTMLGI